MPRIKSNVKELIDLKRRAPKENRAQIDQIIELYSNRKIPSFKTAENIVTRLSVKTSNPTSINKTKKIYDNIITKYSEALPATGRIAREVASKKQKTYSITMILFRDPDDNNTNKVSINVASSSKAQKRKIIDEAEKDISYLRKQKTYSKLKQFYIGSFDIRLGKAEYEYLNDQTDKLVVRGSEFNKVTNILVSRNVIFAHLMHMKGDSYLKGLYLMNLSDSETKG